MKIKRTGMIGIAAGIIILAIDFIFFWGDAMFAFIGGLAFVAATIPFMIDVARESKREQEIGEMFLEFSRNLAESVATGTPISKSIVNMSKKNYGPLTPHIQKLANQIVMGIPVSKALQIFSGDVDNKIIKRAVELIMEAERAGGQIDYILESVANSISEVEKLKKERRAAIFNLVVQGYIIFFIFIGIMLVMEFKILPLTFGVGSTGLLGSAEVAGSNIGIIPGVGTATAQQISAKEISRMFLYLLLTQGFFAGLTIGKLSEGTLRAGIKHSFILTIAAFLISTGAEALLKGA